MISDGPSDCTIGLLLGNQASDKTYDKVVEKLVGAATSLKVGAPIDLDTMVGPIISGAQRGRIEGYTAKGAEEGATVVVVALPFDDEEDAIAMSNGTDFGLADCVFSGDTGRAYQVARQLRNGNVGVHTAQRNDEAPFEASHCPV